MYIRNCPKCNKEINYTIKGNFKRAVINNKICKSCSTKLRNDNPDYLKKISDGRKKYWSEISDEDKEKWRLNNSNAQKNVWKAKDDEFMNYWRETVSSVNKIRWSDIDFKEKMKLILKETNWANNRNHEEITKIMLKTNSTKMLKYGCLFPGGYSKKTIIGELICNSSYELEYIYNLIANGIDLPKNTNPIKTPFGYYTPDFEYFDKFIEVKCKFTYDVLLGINSFSKNKESNPSQLKKINWVSENIKRVEIVVIEKR